MKSTRVSEIPGMKTWRCGSLGTQYETGLSLSHTHTHDQAIEPDRSSVELLGSKVEVKLRKADPFSWAALEHLGK